MTDTQNLGVFGVHKHLYCACRNPANDKQVRDYPGTPTSECMQQMPLITNDLLAVLMSGVLETMFAELDALACRLLHVCGETARRRESMCTAS